MITLIIDMVPSPMFSHRDERWLYYYILGIRFTALLIHDLRINLRCADIAMAEQL